MTSVTLVVTSLEWVHEIYRLSTPLQTTLTSWHHHVNFYLSSISQSCRNRNKGRSSASLPIRLWSGGGCSTTDQVRWDTFSRIKNSTPAELYQGISACEDKIFNINVYISLKEVGGGWYSLFSSLIFSSQFKVINCRFFTTCEVVYRLKVAVWVSPADLINWNYSQFVFWCVLVDIRAYSDCSSLEHTTIPTFKQTFIFCI